MVRFRYEISKLCMHYFKIAQIGKSHTTVTKQIYKQNYMYLQTTTNEQGKEMKQFLDMHSDLFSILQ